MYACKYSLLSKKENQRQIFTEKVTRKKTQPIEVMEQIQFGLRRLIAVAK